MAGSIQSTGSSTGSADGLFTGLGMLGFLGALGYFAYLLVLRPAFAITADVWTGLIAAPAKFGQSEWTNLLWDVAWGAVAGLAVGLFRLWRRRRVLREMIALASDGKTVSAFQASCAGIAVHVLIGALACVLVGLLGLIGPFQLWYGQIQSLTDQDFGVVRLLTAAGIYNAPGVSAGDNDASFVVGVVGFLLVAATVVLAMLTTTFLAGWASGSGFGSLLVALTGLLTTSNCRPYRSWNPQAGQSPLEPFRRHWISAALMSGFVMGLWVGLVIAVAVAICLYQAQDRVVAELGVTASLEERKEPDDKSDDEKEQKKHGAHAVVFRGDGLALVTGDKQATICWDLLTGRQLWSSYPGEDLALSADCEALVAVTSNSKYFRLDPRTGHGNCLMDDTFSNAGIGFLPDGHVLAFKDQHDGVQLRDLDRKVEVRTLHATKAGFLHRIALASHAPVVAGRVEYDIFVWNAADGRLLAQFLDIRSLDHTFALSPDGQTLALCDDHRIQLWEVATQKLLRTLSGHTASIEAMTFSPDGKLLLSGGEDKRLRMWDVATGRGLASAYGHKERIEGVAFSPDGKLAASVSEDAIKLWNVR